ESLQSSKNLNREPGVEMANDACPIELQASKRLWARLSNQFIETLAGRTKPWGCIAFAPKRPLKGPFLGKAVQARRDKESDELHRHPADARDGHRLHDVGASAVGHEYWHEPYHRCSGRHQQGPHSLESGINN